MVDSTIPNAVSGMRYTIPKKNATYLTQFAAVFFRALSLRIQFSAQLQAIKLRVSVTFSLGEHGSSFLKGEGVGSEGMHIPQAVCGRVLPHAVVPNPVQYPTVSHHAPV